MIRNWHIWLMVFLCLGVQGCAVREVREAQETVAQADSLRAEGGMYTDSLRLAQAYETLGTFSPFIFPLSTDFAHACYHYGRLLREKDNPVAAMQCFIAATHSRTRDYHILGRVYSNMGEIAHLAKEYSLSYDMFERSAEMFLRENDSIAYYYALNDMAFELAEQGEKEKTQMVLAKIENKCKNHNVQVKILETKAVACKKVAQYDSVLYYTSLLLHTYRLKEPAFLLLRAQAYSFIGNKDSAVFYANKVLATTDDLYNQNNALYILTNDDETQNQAAIKETASERSDTQKLIEEKRSKYAQAVQLIEQDLTREPDWRWVYAIIAIVLFLCSGGILYYIWSKRKQHSRIMTELQEKEKEQAQLENDINNLSQLQVSRHLQIIEEAEKECQLLNNSNNLRAELCWNDYERMCSIVNLRLYGIINRLQVFSLSEKEVRLCVLVLLNASTKKMVDMIPYAQSGLGKFKYSTAQKLGTTTGNLRTFILNVMSCKAS